MISLLLTALALLMTAGALGLAFMAGMVYQSTYLPRRDARATAAGIHPNAKATRREGLEIESRSYGAA